MISVKRIELGKIVHENFCNSIDLLGDGWQLHPSLDRFFTDLTEGALNILHGDAPAYLLRELPENAVMEMKNTYNPTEVYDVGGFVAYSTDEHKLELYEYYNDFIGTTVSFPYVRMIKEGEEYEGYGSEDGCNWDIRGSIKFTDATLWGLALEGHAGQALKVHSLSVYKGTSLRFRALPLGGKVEVFSVGSDNNVLIGQANEVDYEATISVFNYVMPLKINVKVYDENGDLMADDYHEDVFGGDVYHCGNFLEVYYDGKPLELQQNDFGYLDTFFKDYKLEIRNMINVPHTNVNVEIKKYYEEFGWEWVNVCKDDMGSPDSNFHKVIQFDEVPANGSVFFWVRIMRNSVPVMVDDYLFDFVINVW
ncbi:hypothetical protein [Brevibacillus laterosporus]|uniref:hypothetical protein n=1 Tax=Brevibacillus laterosporus TaxID=1465 RepID=UPI003D22D998